MGRMDIEWHHRLSEPSTWFYQKSKDNLFSAPQVLMGMRERTDVHRNVKAKYLFKCSLEERMEDSQTSSRECGKMVSWSRNELWRLTLRNFMCLRMLSRPNISVYLCSSHWGRKFLLCVKRKTDVIWKGKRQKASSHLSPRPNSHSGNIWSSGL